MPCHFGLAQHRGRASPCGAAGLAFNDLSEKARIERIAQCVTIATEDAVEAQAFGAAVRSAPR